MPAPLAKGIVITVTVLVAAGIAVYESPQVRRWIEASRRKIAFALHNLGDEIHPPSRNRPADVSMTEDKSAEAEQRRRAVREEINLRATLLESRKQTGSSRSPTFDALVDKDGRLKDNNAASEPGAVTTALDSAVVEDLRRRADNIIRRSTTLPDAGIDANPNCTRSLLDTVDTGKLNIPSSTSSNHLSESLVDLTPTSEFPELEIGGTTSNTVLEMQQGSDPGQQPDYFEMISSRSATEDGEPDLYYAHPGRVGQDVNDGSGLQCQPGVSVNNSDGISIQQVSSAPSIASSLSHIQNETFDTASDGTLSDYSYVREELHTPVSWSDVGSVVSSDGGHH